LCMKRLIWICKKTRMGMRLFWQFDYAKFKQFCLEMRYQHLTTNKQGQIDVVPFEPPEILVVVEFVFE